MTNTLEFPQDPIQSENLETKREALREVIKIFYENPTLTELITDEAVKFKNEHPDAYEYILFHDLIGSTPPSHVKKFDMPSNEIENFITHFFDRYQKPQKQAA